MTGGTVLDVSAITDLATQRTVYAAVVLGQAVDRGQDVVLPAAAWLDAWAEASPAAMPFLELLRSNRAGTFAELDEAAARGTELGPTPWTAPSGACRTTRRQRRLPRRRAGTPRRRRSNPATTHRRPTIDALVTNRRR